MLKFGRIGLWLRLAPHCYADATMSVPEPYWKLPLHLISCERYQELSQLYTLMKGTCSLAGRALLNTGEQIK